MSRENLVGTSVRVPPKVLERLEAVSKRTKWSKGELHRQALEFYLGVLESGHFLAPLQVSPGGVEFADEAGADVGEDSAARAFDGVDFLELMSQLEPGAKRGALVGFKELRDAAKVDRSAFDAVVLDLAKRLKISLHQHDFPAGLTAADKAAMYRMPGDEERWAIGCAIRQGK